MAVQLQAGASQGTAAAVEEPFAKLRSETMTTDASSGYASDDSIDMDYETTCSASSLQSMIASHSTSYVEHPQEISHIFNESNAPAPVDPKAPVRLTIPGISKSYRRIIFKIDVSNQNEAHTNMRIAEALTPVGSPTSSGRRTEAWRRQRAGRAKNGSDPVRELLKVASRRLFQSALVPQKPDHLGTEEGLGRAQTAQSSRTAMAKTCVVAQPPSSKFKTQAITCEHMTARQCSHARAQNPVDRFACAVAHPPSAQFDIPAMMIARHCSRVATPKPVEQVAWQRQVGRQPGVVQETAEPCDTLHQSRPTKQNVPMKIMPLLSATNGIAHLNPLEPLYKKVPSYLSEDTFGKALQHFRRALITPPPGLALPDETKPFSKPHIHTRTESFPIDVVEDARKSEF
jgi:hypothetical protein